MTRLFFFHIFYHLTNFTITEQLHFFFRSAVPYSAVEHNDPAAFAVYCDVVLLEMIFSPDSLLFLNGQYKTTDVTIKLAAKN